MTMTDATMSALCDAMRARVLVDAETGCHLWTGYRDDKGYGRVRVGGGRTVKAHRWFYEFALGAIPAGLHICHKCNNTSCVNPDHLYAGTQVENMADRDRAGRHSSKLTADEVNSIRAAYASGETQQSIARRYGVNQSNVSRACRSRGWAGNGLAARGGSN